MTTVERLLRECEQRGPGSKEPDLETVRLAMLVEDVLGVTLSDEQMSAAVLLDPRELQGLMAGRAAHV